MIVVDGVIVRMTMVASDLGRLFCTTISPPGLDVIRRCACDRLCPSNLYTCPACGRPDWCKR